MHVSFYAMLTPEERARLLASHEDVLLRIYGPSDLFGGEAALGNQPRAETITALTRCKALMLPAQWFTDLVTADSGIARAFNVALLKRADAADEQLKLRSAPGDIRLARTLIDLAERAGTETPGGITIPVELPQQDLASLLGTSRSTVARMLHALRERGLIQTSYRNITITDPARLRAAASGQARYGNARGQAGSLATGAPAARSQPNRLAWSRA